MGHEDNACTKNNNNSSDIVYVRHVGGQEAYVMAVQATKFTHDNGEGSFETATDTMMRATAQAMESRRATTMVAECSGFMEHGCFRIIGSPFRAACRCRKRYNRPRRDFEF